MPKRMHLAPATPAMQANILLLPWFVRQLVPKPGTNVVALYKALGGTIPSAMIDYERSVDDTNICVKDTAKLGPL